MFSGNDLKFTYPHSFLDEPLMSTFIIITIVELHQLRRLPVGTSNSAAAFEKPISLRKITKNLNFAGIMSLCVIQTKLLETGYFKGFRDFAETEMFGRRQPL